jgi:hypothetical protein
VAVAELRNSSGNFADFFRVFRREASYRRRGDVRSGARGPHAMAARPDPWPRDPSVRGPGGPSPTLLRISGSFQGK